MQLLTSNKKQLISFGLVGLFNTALTYGIYLTLLPVLTPMISISCGYLIASIAGFLLNQKKVFASNRKLSQTYWRYYLTYGSSFLLTTGLTYLWTTSWSLNKLFAPFFALLFTIPYNFLLSKFWVFQRKEDDQ